MLFKTQSASVYGIDAYLVDVEVDVGSAYMKDFNVVGLPDNAVKESRERINLNSEIEGGFIEIPWSILVQVAVSGCNFGEVAVP